jgi:hypothetical protein
MSFFFVYLHEGVPSHAVLLWQEVWYVPVVCRHCYEYCGQQQQQQAQC